jgi:hypothetical protein
LLPQRRRRSSTALPIAAIVIMDWYALVEETRFNLLIIGWFGGCVWNHPNKKARSMRAGLVLI